MRLKIVLHIKMQFVGSDLMLLNETHLKRQNGNGHGKLPHAPVWSFDGTAAEVIWNVVLKGFEPMDLLVNMWEMQRFDFLRSDEPTMRLLMSVCFSLFRRQKLCWSLCKNENSVSSDEFTRLDVYEITAPVGAQVTCTGSTPL